MTFADLTPPYRTIVADPPWRFDVTQRLAGKGRRPNGARSQYSTLSAAELAALPVGDLAASSAHLWCWAVNGLIVEAHDLVRAWGFRPVTLVTWCKTGRPGLGTYLRGSTEHAVFAVRGTGTVPASPAMSTWFTAPRGAHSVKPAAFFDLVEQVSSGPYLELFQRQGRMGWTGWGLGHESTRESA